MLITETWISLKIPWKITMKNCTRLMACLAGLILFSPSMAQTLIIADGDSLSMQSYNLQTGAQNWSVTSHTLGYPLSVRDTIWLGHRDNLNSAIEYSVATGAPTGNSALLSGGNQSQLLDGATDGTFNYSIRFPNSAVFRADADWTNSVFLFNAPVGGNTAFGITYDTSSNRLWLNAGGNLYRYTLGGVEEFSFAHTGGNGGIAFDSSNNTLWIVPNDPTADLLQYDTSGNFLSSLTALGRSGNVWGAEIQFAAVPEPGTIALLAGLALTGGAGAWWRKRKNNKYAAGKR